MWHKPTRTLCAVLLCYSTFAGTAQADEGSRIFYHEPIRGLTVEEDGEVGENYNKIVYFQAFGRVFELLLGRNTGLRRFPNEPPAEFLRGSVAEDPTSWVRLTRRGDELSGVIRAAHDIYVIEPRRRVLGQLVDPSASADATNVIYRLADSEVPFEELNCATELAFNSDTAQTAFEAVLSELTTPTLAAVVAAERVTIGILADNDLRQLLAPNTEAEILDRLNIVDGIFSEALGIEISVAEIIVFNSNTDPLGSSKTAKTLLESVRAYRTSNQLGLGLTHLITGRNLAGKTAGLAYVGQSGVSGVCTDTGAALTERGSSTFFSALLIAHEIGHNMGAGHDGEKNSACESVPETYLMAPVINGNDEFSQCSIEVMQAVTDTARCINEIPDVDLILNPPNGGTDIDAPLGGEFALSYEIANVGSDTANNIIARLDIPGSFDLIDLSVEGGTCAVTAAECVIDSLSAGGISRLTAVLSPTTPGSYTIGLDVDTPDDRDITTNTRDTNVAVVALPDLQVSIFGISSMEVGATDQASIVVENNSAVIATDVSIDVSMTNGLDLESLSSPEGSCSDTTCTLASLAGSTSWQLELNVTGAREGAMTVTAGSTANENDVEPSDNMATLSFSVVTPVTAPTSTGNTASSGGGGGASHWVIALILAALAACRRYFASEISMRKL